MAKDTIKEGRNVTPVHRIPVASGRSEIDFRAHSPGGVGGTRAAEILKQESQKKRGGIDMALTTRAYSYDDHEAALRDYNLYTKGMDVGIIGQIEGGTLTEDALSNLPEDYGVALDKWNYLQNIAENLKDHPV